MPERILRIEAPQFVAGCVWHKVGGKWRIDKGRCAPILKARAKWMFDCEPQTIPGRLKAKNWKYQWLPPKANHSKWEYQL